jgi:Zn-dependent protease with chaperone function
VIGMIELLRRLRPWVLGWVAFAAGSAATAGDLGPQLAYEPMGLDWSAAEVERTAAATFDSTLQRVQRDRQLGCEHRCARFQIIFDRLVTLARLQTGRARSLPWSLTVVHGSDVQAMALPGGQVFISESFVRSRRLGDEALAFVLGHEMSHSILEHERQTLHFAHMLLPRGVDRNVLDMYTEIDFNLALLKSLEPVLQQGEFEADELGLLLASAAGFAPKLQLVFAEQEARRGDDPTPFVRTHPPAQLRLERLRLRLPLAERLYAASGRATAHGPQRAYSAKSPP